MPILAVTVLVVNFTLVAVYLRLFLKLLKAVLGTFTWISWCCGH